MSGWRLPTRVFLRPGGIASTLPELAASLGKGAALVTDPGVAATPWPGRVEAALRAGGVALRLKFTGVEANPRTTTVDALATAVRDSGADFLIALGGGSAIDAAKAAAMLARNPGGILDYTHARNSWSARPLPLLAVPTTCGTGSEVTWVSVLTVRAPACCRAGAAAAWRAWQRICLFAGQAQPLLMRASPHLC